MKALLAKHSFTLPTTWGSNEMKLAIHPGKYKIADKFVSPSQLVLLQKE